MSRYDWIIIYIYLLFEIDKYDINGEISQEHDEYEYGKQKDQKEKNEQFHDSGKFCQSQSREIDFK